MNDVNEANATAIHVNDPEPISATAITGSTTLLFAAAVGVIVTNLSAPQTLVRLIGHSIGLAPASDGLVAMSPLLGYALGQFVLVPLADLHENRALIVRLLVCAALATGAVALAPNAASLLVLLLALGTTCSAIQILVPLAASMAPAERRGRVIGNVMSGLMLGILLSRPLASSVAGTLGWRAFFVTDAVMMLLLTVVLAVRLPRRHPPRSLHGYTALLASLWEMARRESTLQHRALNASLGMAAFSLFWTAIALRLAQPPFDLTQRGIAVFALVGAGGVFATPIAGNLGDRGLTTPAMVVFHLCVVAAFALAAWSGITATQWTLPSLILMGLSAVLLDIGVTGDQTLGRRAINLLRPEVRGRLNGLYVGIFFLGGAAGSALAGIAWAWGGWSAICLVGAGFGLAALLGDILLAMPRRGCINSVNRH